MSAVTAEATEQMTRRWCDQILQSGAQRAAEIRVDRAISDLTAGIIGRVAFGTRDQEAGEVLQLLHEMQAMGAAAMLDAPILWYAAADGHRPPHFSIMALTSSDLYPTILGICRLGAT